MNSKAPKALKLKENTVLCDKYFFTTIYRKTKNRADKLIYIREGRGISKVKYDDPYLCRLVFKKK